MLFWAVRKATVPLGPLNCTLASPLAANVWVKALRSVGTYGLQGIAR